MHSGGQPSQDGVDVQSGGLGRRRHVERLMGRDPALRFGFIQSRASAVEDDAIDA